MSAKLDINAKKLNVVPVRCHQLQGALSPDPHPHSGKTNIVAHHFGATFVCGRTLLTSCAPLSGGGVGCHLPLNLFVLSGICIHYLRQGVLRSVQLRTQDFRMGGVECYRRRLGEAW